MAISFKGAHFPPEVILMGVRWYVAYPLSTRHVEELSATWSRCSNCCALQNGWHNPLSHQRYPTEMCGKVTTCTEPPDNVPTVKDWHRNREATMSLSAPRRSWG